MRPPEEIKDLLKESKASVSSEKNSKILKQIQTEGEIILKRT